MLDRGYTAWTALVLLAVMGIGGALSAQGATTLSHSTDDTTVTVGNSVACATATPDFFHADNSYLRYYDLSVLFAGNDFLVQEIRFGVERDRTTTGVNDIEIRIWAAPVGVGSNWANMIQLGATETFTTPGNTSWEGTVQTYCLLNPILVPMDTVFAIELFTPDNQGNGGSFFIGSNAAGQSSPTFISTPDCAGLADPTDVATITFPDMHMILDVIGAGPSIDVQQPAATSIPNGSTTHNIGNVSTGTLMQFTFTIANRGWVNLNLLGTPMVTVSGQSNCTAIVLGQPSAALVTRTSPETFVLNVQALGLGALSFDITVLTDDTCYPTYTATINGTGAANIAPTITAASAISRQPGGAAGNSNVATVSDIEDADGTLTVVTTVVPAGISVTLIVNTAGVITADVSAAAGTTDGAYLVTFQVTDSGALSSTAVFTVNVLASGTGGPGPKSGGGCSTGTGALPWALLFAVLSLLGMALRLRAGREA